MAKKKKVPAERLSPEQLSVLAQWWNRVPLVLGGQDRHAMSEFEGQTIDGIELPTDPDLVEMLGFLGELDIDDFYMDPDSTT